MSLYRCRFFRLLDHTLDVFLIQGLACENDAEAIAMARRMSANSEADRFELWKDERCVHIETPDHVTVPSRQAATRRCAGPAGRRTASTTSARLRRGSGRAQPASRLHHLHRKPPLKISGKISCWASSVSAPRLTPEAIGRRERPLRIETCSFGNNCPSITSSL